MVALVLIITQVLFTTGDLIARHYLPKQGFHLASFLTIWFALYVGLRSFATIGQLYVLSTTEIGKAYAWFSVAGIILANLLGVMLLGDVLSTKDYVGVCLAVLAFMVLALGKV